MITVGDTRVRVGRLRTACGPLPGGTTRHVDVHYAIRYLDGWQVWVAELPCVNPAFQP
ncbi:hypothetical protein GCM10009682_51180 [Luedemannella flava]|uniref:Uncharacterized protein n=1 Tax=Luedemannella flava TaxID=349316 RepID=A0ABN2MFL6_9ACTN